MNPVRAPAGWITAVVAGFVLVCALPFTARAQSAPPVADLTAQARKRAEQGDLLGARTRLAEAFKLDPTYGPAWLELASIHERAGDPAEALRVYQAGIDRVPAFVNGFRARARLFERMGRIEEASLDVLMAITVAPDDPKVREEGLEFYVRRRAWSAALQQSRAIQVLCEARCDSTTSASARVRTLALGLLAAESDPVRGGGHHRGWERTSIAAIGTRLGVL